MGDWAERPQWEDQIGVIITEQTIIIGFDWVILQKSGVGYRFDEKGEQVS